MPKEDVTVDHYAALGISVTATADEIRKQFRKLALKYHPDRNPGREAEFNAKFQQIQAAHELLTDAVRRKLYDRSRLYHTNFSKTKAEQYTEASAASREPPSRKYSATGATRSSFPHAHPRTGEPHFSPSSKTQWEQSSRHYNQNGPSAWKATHEKWPPRTTREAPRTPKKTRENPYASPDADPRSSREQFYTKTYKDDGSGGGTPLKHSFFGDRNPREREWMDSPTDARTTGNSNRNGSNIWETKSSSEEDAPRTSTFYAYTPQTRLRTNLRDTSPDKPTAHGINQTTGTSGKNTAASPGDPSVSPLRSGPFPRSQTTRDQRDYGEQQIPPQAHDRRKSSSSIGLDGPERRKFSYLFNEDGSRRPHRPAKQNGGSDQDAEEDLLFKSRNIPIRQSYPSSRRNTLDRDPIPSKLPSDSKATNGVKHADRSRFNPPSSSQTEGFQTPLNPFKPFEAGRSSPISASPVEQHQHPQTFSMADWNAMFSSDENIFAVPVRKGQQSPRKVPVIPKIQTTFNSGNVQLNFSRPRPTSTSAEASSKTDDSVQDKQSFGPDLAESLESNSAQDNFSKNTFAFEDWEKAFSENNPFNVNPNQQNASSAAARSTSRHRKATNMKKSATPFPQTKTPNTDGTPHPEGHPTDGLPKMPSENPEAFHSQSSDPVYQQAAQSGNPQTSNMPSPLAMDIDTPRESPKPAPAIPVTPANRNFTTMRNSGIYHSPTVSDENPVSPIKGDGPPISPLRAEEVPRRDEDTEGQSPISSTCRSPPPDPEAGEIPPATTSSINLDTLRGVEPMTYASSAGLDGSWRGMQDTLPFNSKAAPVLNLSPSPPPQRTPIMIPTPPEAPTMPSVPSAASYDRVCAAMTVYQTHWNEYNAKIVNHLRARLETDVLRCAQNKGFATGTSSDPKAGVQIDLTQTQKALAELEEDEQVRGKWHAAIKNHTCALMQWKKYLEQLHTAGELS
ncbi:hypothetical protein Dda_8018 [Drechslerella dactyloides]|uniref:J domain-containing protein n=1 Tax=Drechslerella dactyloides TaxID=74499 RepID=A0AAD6IRA0_DREDA|nr:hypothetical protein Dda_8018 [Drechslerella dactyloides]